MRTVLVNVESKSTCQPAGAVEISVRGEMCIEDAGDAIAMLELAIKQILRVIDKVSEEV